MIALAAAVRAILCFLGFILLVVFVLFPRDDSGFVVVAIILGFSGSASGGSPSRGDETRNEASREGVVGSSVIPTQPVRFQAQ